MRDVYIVQCLMETDLYKLLKTQVSFDLLCICLKEKYVFSNSLYRGLATIISVIFYIRYYVVLNTYTQQMSCTGILNQAIYF